jgi:hypothetical protein
VSLPDPHPNLVIRYAYLWHANYLRGQEEGDKDRPCVIVLTAQAGESKTIVTVLPITHTPPNNPDEAIEIPMATKQRLELDAERSWVICSEINRFVWPGPDLRPIPGRSGQIVYGELPYRLFEQIKERLLRLHAARRLQAVARTQ